MKFRRRSIQDAGSEIPFRGLQKPTRHNQIRTDQVDRKGQAVRPGIFNTIKNKLRLKSTKCLSAIRQLQR